MTAIDDYLAAIEAQYGAYLDAVTGLRVNYSRVMEAQEASSKQLGLSIEDLDSRAILYGSDDPNTPVARVFHRRTQGAFKKQNKPEGENEASLGQACLVTIYQYWEDRYRKAIADERDTPKNEVQSNLMGEVRNLRHAIIHNAGRATSDVETCVTLNWFKRGDPIHLTQDHVHKLVSAIRDELTSMRTS